MILSGEITKKVTLNGLIVTKGAKAAIEAAGGTVTELVIAPVVKKLPAKAKASA